MRCKNPMVIHYVHDMDRAKEFYVKSFQVSPLMESDGWTTLDLDSIVLALHILPAGSDGVLPNAGLCLEVRSINFEVQHLKDCSTPLGLDIRVVFVVFG